MWAIGNSSQSRDLTILNWAQIRFSSQWFVIADSTWVKMLEFVVFKITYTLPWVENLIQFPSITDGISNNSKFYNLETPRIYNYNALVVSDSNEIQSASFKIQILKAIRSESRTNWIEYSDTHWYKIRIATRNDSSFKYKLCMQVAIVYLFGKQWND